MADVEKGFATNSDNQRLRDLQFSTGSHAEWKLGVRPAKYNVAEVTPFRFCWYFGHDSAGLVASHILKTNMKVAVCFCS